MKKLFNKSFFRFLFGFVMIIAASFIIISLVGYYSEGIAGGNKDIPIPRDILEAEVDV